MPTFKRCGSRNGTMPRAYAEADGRGRRCGLARTPPTASPARRCPRAKGGRDARFITSIFFTNDAATRESTAMPMPARLIMFSSQAQRSRPSGGAQAWRRPEDRPRGGRRPRGRRHDHVVRGDGVKYGRCRPSPRRAGPRSRRRDVRLAELEVVLDSRRRVARHVAATKPRPSASVGS